VRKLNPKRRLDFSNEGAESRTLRASKKAYVALLGICFVLVLMAVYLFISLGSRQALGALLLSGMATVFWAIWLRWHKLDVGSDGISYRRPFRASIRLKWEDIENLHVRDVLSGRRTKVDSSLSGIIVRYSGRSLLLNPRIFDPTQLKEVVDYIGSKCGD